MLRCNLTKSVELELIILMSLMTLLDKSNDTSWKRDLISKGFLQEDAVSALAQQKKNKSVLLNEQKLQFRLEKEARRSQKQIQTDILQKHNYNKISLSADNSPTQTPKCSPLPTPSTSSNRSSLRLKHRKSVSAMN
ncbi:hypothetical protein BDF20DRAFT_801828, partial [Mycotypha africana]|uniref:uncharacterized protein n=1 Tax=Mycotypha africana TaxID=64632 RepID=UPI00230139B8